MSKRARRIIIFFVFVFIVGGGYVLVQFLLSSGGVPKEFTDARLQSALIAQDIVNLSNQSVIDLAKINELDMQGKSTEALNLTTDVIKQSQQIRDRAVELSGQIEIMTRSLSNIDSLEARQAALESIANRLALISRLINYSGYLGQLLDTLRSHFVGSTQSGNKDVELLIDQINGEVRAINNFNSQATQSMNKFDKIVSQ
jgi:hypothetical protein